MGQSKILLASMALLMGCSDSHERPGLVGDVVEIMAKGLHTDPNARALPEGALRVANNVVIRSPGVIEPRRGMEKFGVDANGTVHYAHYYDGSYIYAAETSGTKTWRKPTSTVLQDEDSSGVNWDNVEELDALQAAGNLYFTTSSGVRRISSASDATAYRAGLVAPVISNVRAWPAASDESDWLADGDSVAYRAVIKREVNGRTLRSPPSGRLGVTNGDGTSRLVQISVDRPSNVLSTDVIELYRTDTHTGDWQDAGDRMSLAVAVRESEISGTITDSTSPNDRDAALYTNESQQGIGQSNWHPPKAGSLALYNGMAMYGASSLQHQLGLVLLRAGNGGFGKYDTTGDFTSGSDTIANVASFDGVKVGMYITDSLLGPPNDGAHIPSGTTITAFDSGTGTITMSANATATTTNAAFSSVDWVKVNSVVFYAYGRGGVNSFEAGLGVEVAAAGLAEEINSNSGLSLHALYTGTQDNPGSLFIFHEQIPGSQITVTGSRGDAWSPRLAQSGTDVQSTSLDRPNRVYYSKLDQPEHVPLNNWFEVGDPEEPILRMVPLRDVMIIFKTDGVWRLSGRTPQTLRLDPLDVDTVLIHPHAVDVLDNRAIAWTNRGIVAVTASGVSTQSLSDPISSDTNGVQETQLREIRDTSSWGDTSGIWIRCNTNRSECYVGFPEGFGFVLVFNAYTGAWTTWSQPGDLLKAEMGAVDPLNDALVLMGAESGGNTRLYKERTDSDRTIYSDDDGNGDTAFTTTVEWHPFSGGAWHRDKFWRECILYLEDAADVDQVDWTFYDADRQSSGTFSVSGTNVSSARNRQVRVNVPREATRGPSLGVKVSVDDIYARYRISVLRCSYEPMADRLETTL